MPLPFARKKKPKKDSFKKVDTAWVDNPEADSVGEPEHFPTPPHVNCENFNIATMENMEADLQDSVFGSEEEAEGTPEAMAFTLGELMRDPNPPEENSMLNQVEVEEGFMRYQEVFFYCFLLPTSGDLHVIFDQMYLGAGATNGKLKVLEDHYHVRVRSSARYVFSNGKMNQIIFLFGQSVTDLKRMLCVMHNQLPELDKAITDVSFNNHNSRAYIEEQQSRSWKEHTSVLKLWAAHEKDINSLIFWYRQVSNLPLHVVDLENCSHKQYTQEVLQSNFNFPEYYKRYENLKKNFHDEKEVMQKTPKSGILGYPRSITPPGHKAKTKREKDVKGGPAEQSEPSSIIPATDGDGGLFPQAKQRKRGRKYRHRDGIDSTSNITPNKAHVRGRRRRVVLPNSKKPIINKPKPKIDGEYESFKWSGGAEGEEIFDMTQGDEDGEEMNSEGFDSIKLVDSKSKKTRSTNSSNANNNNCSNTSERVSTTETNLGVPSDTWTPVGHQMKPRKKPLFIEFSDPDELECLGFLAHLVLQL